MRSNSASGRLSVAAMTATHSAMCREVCTLWRGNACQRPLVAAVMHHPDPGMCVRSLGEALALRAAINKNKQ